MFTRLLGMSTEFTAAAALSSFDAFVTIAHRIPILASGRGHDEAFRMVSEKVEAAIQGSFDATLAAGELFGRAATGNLHATDVPEGLYTVGKAALKPAYTRVRANARRLSSP